MNRVASQVVIRDDGELTNLRRLLDEIGVSYDSGARNGESTPLLVTTPRYALGRKESGTSLPDCGTHIVMAKSFTQTVRAQLQRYNCDYVVEESFHHTALQLLILHSLYQGPERRKLDRIAAAEPVKLKVGWRNRDATLVQLSPRGCGIACSWNCDVDSALTLNLPKTMTGGAAMAIPARVVGRDSTNGGERQLSLAFTSLTRGEVKMLLKVMDKLAGGNSRMTPIPESKPGAAAAPKPKNTIRPSSFKVADRRSDPRAEYGEQVLAAGKGNARALIGRDLSVGGMLVEPNDDLVVGEQVKLILFGHSDKEPIVVRASVLRDAGSDGIALRFADLGEATAARLEELVQSLPVLSGENSLGVAIEGGQPVVVSELVERG